MLQRYQLVLVAFLAATSAGAKPFRPSRPPPPPPSGPVERLEVHGSIDDASIRVQLSERMAKVEDCRPGEKGWRFSLSLSILPSGDVVGRRAQGLPERSVRDCVEAAFADLAFPSAATSTTVEAHWRVGGAAEVEVQGTPGCRAGLCVRARLVRGALSNADVTAKLDTIAQSLRACFAPALDRGVDAEWTVTPSGRVARVSVKGASSAVRNCVRSRIERLRFARAAESTAVIASIRADASADLDGSALVLGGGVGGLIVGGRAHWKNGSSTVAIRHVQVRGGLAIRDVVQTVQRASGPIERCYVAAFPRGSRPRQSARVSLAIAARGAIESLRVVGLDRKLRLCVEHELRRFPFAHAPTQTHVRFELDMTP